MNQEQQLAPQDRGTLRDPMIAEAHRHIEAARQRAVDLPASGVRFKPYPATVGRAVHYTSHATEHEQKACRHATVTVAEDEQGRVGLCVTNPGGHEFLTAVDGHHIDENDPEWPRSAEGVQGRQSGTWHWPERV